MKEATKLKTPQLHNVDEYLKVVFWTQFQRSGMASEAEKLFKPLEEVMEEKLGGKDYDIAYECLWDGFNEIVRRAGIAGMKMAIAIENGEYTMFV